MSVALTSCCLCYAFVMFGWVSACTATKCKAVRRKGFATDCCVTLIAHDSTLTY
jgi:hypothetical protein